MPQPRCTLGQSQPAELVTKSAEINQFTRKIFREASCQGFLPVCYPLCACVLISLSIIFSVYHFVPDFIFVSLSVFVFASFKGTVICQVLFNLRIQANQFCRVKIAKDIGEKLFLHPYSVLS